MNDLVEKRIPLQFQNEQENVEHLDENVMLGVINDYIKEKAEENALE